MTEHAIACRHGQTGECPACLSERSDELAKLRAERDAVSEDGPMVVRADGSHCTMRTWAREMKAERDAANLRYANLKKHADATIQGFEEAVGSLPQAQRIRTELDAARALLREVREDVDAWARLGDSLAQRRLVRIDRLLQENGK